jgi:hypothetical protein
MSQMGQKRRFERGKITSGLPSTPDIHSAHRRETTEHTDRLYCFCLFYLCKPPEGGGSERKWRHNQNGPPPAFLVTRATLLYALA